MNTKVPIKQLSEQVARKVNIEATDAQGAIKSIFTLIADVLKDGKSVTLDGLGTFTPDVNPQEPVGFRADADLADQLNAPFAMFEPEIIADNLSNAELAAAGETVDTSVETAETATIATPSTGEVASSPANVQPTSAPESRPRQVGWASARVAEEPAPKPSVYEESAPEVQSAPEIPSAPAVHSNEQQERKEEPVRNTPKANAEINLITNVEPAPSATPQKTPDIPPVAPIPAAEPPVQPQHATNPSVASEIERNHRTAVLEVPEWPEEEENEDSPSETYASEPAEDQGRFKAGFFWGLIVGLLIGALLLFGYAMYFSQTV